MMFTGVPLTDPDGSQPLVAAIRWIEQTLLGTTATIVATMAIAAIGFLMLTGRVPLRRGATVVLGCFIVFGATTIAAGIMGLRDQSASAPRSMRWAPEQLPPAPIAPPAQPQVYDPYAGASVPNH